MMNLKEVVFRDTTGNKTVSNSLSKVDIVIKFPCTLLQHRQGRGTDEFFFFFLTNFAVFRNWMKLSF